VTALRRSAPPEPEAQGRLDHGPPIAVIDIGSNSVRVVIYEGLARSPTPIFNEKVLAGLGREVRSTGLLNAEAADKALLRQLSSYPTALGMSGGVMIVMSGPIRSGQSLMCFGLVFRTTKTIVEV